MTHLDLLNKLPSPYREQAIKNNSEEYLQDSRYKALSNALLQGFPWEYSPQGYDYWMGIYYRALAGEFDKPKDPSVTLPMEDWDELKAILQREADTHGGSRNAETIYQAIKQQLKP